MVRQSTPRSACRHDSASAKAPSVVRSRRVRVQLASALTRILAAGISVAAASFGAGLPALAGDVTAIKAGRLIDGTGAPPLAGAVVLVEDGRISAVGTGIKIPEGAKVIDLGESCLTSLPDDATVLNNVATCLLRSGHMDRARTLLERAIALKPNDPYLRYNLACVSAKEKKKDDAVGGLKEACRLGLAPANFR